MQTGGASRLSINDVGVLLGGANARVTTILDEDNMASNSATALATQQSIKAYVDASGGGGIGGSIANTQVAYGNGTDIAGEAAFTYNDSTNKLTVKKAEIEESLIAPIINNTVVIEPNPGSTSNITMSTTNGPLFVLHASQGGIAQATLPSTSTVGETYRIAWNCGAHLLGNNAKIQISIPNNVSVNGSSTTPLTIHENTGPADNDFGITELVCIDDGNFPSGAPQKWIAQTSEA
jgi:hypothetical protein